MEYNYYYSTKDAKDYQTKQAESKGLVMLHDNFIEPNWKHGDPQIGVLIFTDSPPIAPIEPLRRDALKELDELKVELKDKGVIK